ncbi:MAG: type I 3-dehydroquinate dehydratase [Candidatus Bathyarchaeia archaeon]
MTIRICVSILPSNVDEALNLIGKAEKHKPDFIEVRLDCIKEHERLVDIKSCTKVPLIATNRTQECRGKFSGSEVERRRTLLKAARSGFEYVDIELHTSKLREFVEELRQLNVKPIISFHDFNETPSPQKMKEVLECEVAEGADICKIVTTAKKVDDNLTVLNFLHKASRKAKLVCFAMGPLGKPSRLLSPLFGGFFTIASLEHGGETAPGQMTIQELRTAYQALGAK